jgi:hypothetical protein
MTLRLVPTKIARNEQLKGHRDNVTTEPFDGAIFTMPAREWSVHRSIPISNIKRMNNVAKKSVQ